MVTAPSFLSSLYYYIITITTILLLFNITIIIDGRDLKAGGICKGQEEKNDEMAYKNQKQSQMNDKGRHNRKLSAVSGKLRI